MNTRRFVVKRAIQGLITLWAIATILFMIFRVLPGDPTSAFIDVAMDAETKSNLLDLYGLNEPLWVQYYKYILNAVTLDWGLSIHHKEPVFTVLFPRLLNTLVLMLPIAVLSILFAIILGTIAAWYRQSKIDMSIVSIAFAGRSVPVFFSGVLLLLVFSYHLGWFPVGTMRSSTAEYSGYIAKYVAWDFVYHWILPVTSGVFYYMSLPTLLMRNSMISTLGEPFLNVLKAKGLSERAIMFKHAARNSLLPVSTAAALAIGYAVGGQVVLETVFSWPGIGRAIVVAINQRDYPTAQAALMLMATMIVFMNFVADVVYTYLDPRVTYDER